MILAYLNGDLIIVDLIQSHPITTRVRDMDGKEYCCRVSDNHRKLFDGENAVYHAIAWIEQQNGVTIHVIN